MSTGMLAEREAPVCALVGRNDIDADVRMAVAVHLQQRMQSAECYGRFKGVMKQPYLESVVNRHGHLAGEPVVGPGKIQGQVHGRKQNDEATGGQGLILVG